MVKGIIIQTTHYLLFGGLHSAGTAVLLLPGMLHQEEDLTPLLLWRWHPAYPQSHVSDENPGSLVLYSMQLQVCSN